MQQIQHELLFLQEERIKYVKDTQKVRAETKWAIGRK